MTQLSRSSISIQNRDDFPLDHALGKHRCRFLNDLSAQKLQGGLEFRKLKKLFESRILLGNLAHREASWL